MKRLHVKAMTGMRINTKDGACALYVLDDRGNKAEIHMSIPVLARAAVEAQRGTRSYESREVAGPLDKRGKWEELPMLDIRSIDVAILPMEQPPHLVLVLDKGMETQLAFRLPVEAAEAVAKRLVEQSAECKNLSSLKPEH
jgi:hypothetical protein